MDATAELFDVEEHPKASVIREVQEALASLKALNAKHGGLLTQAQVAVLTGLSPQRIHQLQQAHTLGRVQLKASNGEALGTFVPVPDVVEWLKANPRPGIRYGSKAKLGAKLILAATDVS